MMRLSLEEESGLLDEGSQDSLWSLKLALLPSNGHLTISKA